MEKTLVLKAEVRATVGSSDSVQLRNRGRIPAIAYGHKQTPTPMSLDAHEFSLGLHHGHRLVDVDVDGKIEPMIIKDLQYDFLGKKVIHVDFIRVDVTQSIKVSVPLELKGVAQGTFEGGIIEEHAGSLDIEAIVTNLPDVLVVSIKDIGVGDAIHAEDVVLPAGVKLVSPKDTLILTCHLKAAAKSAEDGVETEGAGEEGAVSPEVITERKADEDS